MLEDLHNQYPSDGEPLIINMEILLEINEGEQNAFESRYLLLIEKYGIPEDAAGDILYINQKITHDLTNLDIIRNADTQTLNALDFLIGYQKLVDDINIKKAQNKTGYTTNEEDPITIQVKDRHSNGAVPLLYEGSGRFIVKMIYQALKTSFNNTALSYILDDYPEIPPLEQLIYLRGEDMDSRKLIAREMVAKTASILSAYFEKYIPKPVYSKKKNSIIYELFYLFDTLKYAGKVMDVDSSTLIRMNLKKDYTLPLDKSRHADFIKEVIKNDHRRDHPLSGAFLTFTKS
ncbi:hypothetical protein [Pedobacter hartonius]|nr:hypothetical protein [Pedobacter hartonius]